jgi:2-iminobutanoate/2-iminopropanoate deaminase
MTQKQATDERLGADFWQIAVGRRVTRLVAERLLCGNSRRRLVYHCAMLNSDVKHEDPEHPYPAASERNGVIAVSGRLGVSRPGVLVEGGFEAEAEAALDNVRAALAEVGADFSDLVQVVVYLTNMDDREALNGIYARHLGDSRPARSCVGVASLPYGGCVEIEAIAVRSPDAAS